MTAVLGMVLELIYRRGAIALAAGLVSTLGFVLADQLPLTFSPSIQPLQAVLRSNYWLIIHVLTIVSPYAAFALAWGLGNFNLALILYAPRRDLIEALSWFCYRAIQVGILLLFLGTMLGGFWAAESWGRFWGWDPKEVWALVALLCYVIPLHARYTGWVRGRRPAQLWLRQRRQLMGLSRGAWQHQPGTPCRAMLFVRPNG
jgi:ABC-type transport system involved in cytochrome c biogenesis permease subunit